MDKDLFPSAPVWRGTGAQAQRDAYARQHGMTCLLAYTDGKANCYLALPSLDNFCDALHRSLLNCWSEDCPESEREDAAFLEQLYGQCSPYIDVDLHAPKANESALKAVLAAAKNTDACGQLGAPTVLVSTREKDGGYKLSYHPIFSKAEPQPYPTNSPEYPPRKLANQLHAACPDAGIDCKVYTSRRNFRC
eukprot:COSAG06_NODE_21667_length_749_cov_1.187692_1_plen_191_part_10